tara:strand:- start:4630 stop:5586 length:957 start_codon:yes stop_codon:yes gene_type:complete
MNKIKLYVYPDAKPHVHDTQEAQFYYNTVPLSAAGIEQYCDLVEPDQADYFYMGQLNNNQSLHTHDPYQSWPYFQDNEHKHICDYEGEGGQEQGAGGATIPTWLHNSIITLNGPLTSYTTKIKRLFTRPTFSHLLMDIIKNQNDTFKFPSIKSIGFKGYLNHSIRQIMANAYSHHEPFNTDISFNNKWEGPSETGSIIQQQYIETMLRHPISLCPRGSGIDSVRLLETCYYNRVPVLISDYDYCMVGDGYYDTSFCFRICRSISTPEYLIHEMHRLYDTSLSELEDRANLARKYFDIVIRKYFDDPTLYFLYWLQSNE